MLLSKRALSETTGRSISVIDSWIYRHGLPVVKIGGRVYIDESDYSAWVQEHKTVLTQKPAATEKIALPTQCRKSSLSAKMRRIY